MIGKGDKTQHNEVLLVTNTRVVFYRKGVFGEVIETIPLDKLTSVERRSALGHHSIRMHTSHDTLEFKTFNTEKLAAIVPLIEAGTGATLVKPQENCTSGDAPLEMLKKLGELRGAGVITDDAFEAKKRELLSRL